MATYNGELYVWDQLMSLVNQSHMVQELIISDDCSTDSTKDLLKEFYEKYKEDINIVLLFNDVNVGYSKNFERALNCVTGDFVFLCDQDDIWFDNKVEYFVQHQQLSPASFVFMCDVSLSDEKLRDLGQTKQQILALKGLTVKSYVMGASAMINAEYLKAILPLPSVLVSHDEWIIGSAHRLEKVMVFDIVLQKYRRHGNNASEAFYNSVDHSMLSKIKLFCKVIKHRDRMLSLELKKSHILYYRILRNLKSSNVFDDKNLSILVKYIERTTCRCDYINRNFISRLYRFNRHRGDFGLKGALLDLFAF